jgi:nucleotide-binding universal stress UspA family protein
VEVSGNSISHEHAGRILLQEGTKVRREFFGPEAVVSARASAPANPPGLLIVGADGSRYRTNEADRKKRGERREKRDTGEADAADPPSEAESARETAFDGIAPRDRDSGWRENKVGVVIRAEPGSVGPDGKWQPPREIVKTYVATTEGIESFGRDLRTEAERRGIERAKEVVFVSDNGHGIPRMREREFPEAHHVTDFKHASDRLKDTARIVCGEGDAAAQARAVTRHGLKALLWDGKVDEVIAEVAREAGKLAPRPAKLAELSSRPDAKAIWGHVFYFEKRKGTMDYPEYRKEGWPIASSSVESACGQMGDRVKHARMRWTRPRADAVHQVKAAILSQDGRWEKRWPGPIPVLEVPLLEYLAPAA